MTKTIMIVAVCVFLTACKTETVHSSFGDDLAFLSTHVETIVLGANSGSSRVAVVPAWQGRVMTSTDAGDSGMSYGWLNRPLIKEGIAPENEREGLEQHIYVFGGEDRFWIGPEGGQFSWYFPEAAAFEFENWKVPAFIDTDPWTVTHQDDSSVRMEVNATIKNWSGHSFSLGVEREVAVLDHETVARTLGIRPGADVNFVAYESRNTLSNTGEEAWETQSGLPSIWILGMLKHGAGSTVFIPYEKDVAGGSETIVKDDYFGKVPADRLIVDQDTGVIYFSADGTHRSKIGINQARSLGVAGCWDAVRDVLTIVQYNAPRVPMNYVNSSWELQQEPYQGDAINSYNDGPVEGGQLGPFYELETSSPALALTPGEGYRHVQRTIHLTGEREQLNLIAVHVFGVHLDAIEDALQ
jgi:hypothetical protein